MRINEPLWSTEDTATFFGVSVRTLHFYDEVGLLKPAYVGANGYRFYEEPQLLSLQQILFYRELGFELKQIKEILSRADFENYKKRAAREKEEATKYANSSLLERLVAIIDNFELGLSAARAEGEQSPIYSGMTLVLKQLNDFLADAISRRRHPFDDPVSRHRRECRN